jgi:hypothetical protein
MNLIGIRVPKPRKFSYKPVYYDPVKEGHENRLKEAEYEKDLPGSELRMRLRMRMNRKQGDQRKGKRTRMLSLFITLTLLFLVLYYIFSR